MKQAPRLLVIVPADLDSAVKKGVAQLFETYDESGFFGKVVLVSPYIRRDRVVMLTSRHEYREYGWAVTSLGRRAKLLAAPWHFLRLALACRRIVREQGISLIRANEPTYSGLLAWSVSRLTGIPYCVSLHADYDQRHKLDKAKGAPTLFGSRRLVFPLERFTLSHAALVMPIRESLVDYALARGVSPAKIGVIPHGVDLTPFVSEVTIDVRKALGIPDGKSIVAFAGRFSAENYIGDMLEAARSLAGERDDFVLVMAGGGDMEKAVEERVAADPLLNRVVRLLGFVPREVVCALRRACQVSLCLMGGFSLIEACAAGSPVVAYDVEWHRELVINGRTGRLVAEHDVGGVAEAVAWLLDHPAEARRMGAEGRSLAFARHEIGVASELKRRCYRRILEG